MSLPNTPLCSSFGCVYFLGHVQQRERGRLHASTHSHNRSQTQFTGNIPPALGMPRPFLTLFFFHIFFLVFLPTRLFCHLWDQVDLQNQEPGSFHCTNPVGTNLWILTAKQLFSVKECWGPELVEKWQCAMCVFVCCKQGGNKQMITKQ